MSSAANQARMNLPLPSGVLWKQKRGYNYSFADNGDTFDYESETVKLSHKYDFKAPEWDSSLDVREENGDLILSWEEPWDESGIYGYRIYMDGKPVYADEDDYFNHVNSSCTTTKPAIEFQELILKPLIPLK